ncbi:hypothetical protein HD806DRAFT_533140 [Xylariaceae sp. AK1471]|nr:hypothetical protein HD806DRAFT_533140 [Xylariaceae sp. AK1471]
MQNADVEAFNVFATFLSHGPREHLTKGKIHAYASGVTKDEDITALKESIESQTSSGLDVLVDCAGICYTMTVMDTDVSEIEEVFSVNVFGLMRMVYIFYLLLIRIKGTVINIGSVGLIIVFEASYNAFKAALHHRGNTLRVEMKPFDVKVINVISGEVGTDILKRDQQSLRKLSENSYYRPQEGEFQSHINRTPVEYWQDAPIPVVPNYAPPLIIVEHKQRLPRQPCTHAP